MTRQARRIVAVALCLLALLAACQPRPAPEATARAYLDAWEHADYAAMYALLADVSRARVDAGTFAARYAEASAAAELRALTTVLGERAGETENRVAFTVTARWDTALLGRFGESLTLPLTYADGRWTVEWQPTLLLRDLGDADSVRYVPEPAPRGAIVDRADLPLAPAGVERTYPEGALAAHVLGYVHPGEPVAVGPRPSALSPQPGTRDTTSHPGSSLITHHSSLITPRPNSALVGSAGVERWADDFLRGSAGGRLAIVGPDGQERRTVAARPAQTGATVRLTLDAALQRQAEALLDGRVGALVALDPRDGAVLALADRPTFEPAALSGADPPAAPNGTLRDRATEGTYPVASLFKVVMMAAGLELGEYDPATPFRCTGAWSGLGGRLALEDSVAGGHGRLTLAEGVVQSCNTVFYEMGKRFDAIDPHLLPAVARSFGLGKRTGLVGLDEAPGVVPDPRLREAEGSAWTTWDAVEVAIGHGGLEATPLQLARLYAALATDGLLRPPLLVRRVVAADGRLLHAAGSETQGALPLSESHRAAVQAAMRGVVADPRGTAAPAFRGFAIPTGGKTGSAESDGPRLHAWFAGYAPIAAPEIVVVALIEHGGGGGEIAAPIVRGVLEAYFAER